MSSNTENIAVFCTGNKEYIPMMVASLGIVALKTGFHPWIITDAKDQETKDLVSSAIKETGAKNMSDLGKVMPAIMKLGGGLIDGKKANIILRQLLD